MGATREHVEKGLELWNRGDFDNARTLMADDAVWVQPAGSSSMPAKTVLGATCVQNVKTCCRPIGSNARVKLSSAAKIALISLPK